MWSFVLGRHEKQAPRGASSPAFFELISPIGEIITEISPDASVFGLFWLKKWVRQWFWGATASLYTHCILTLAAAKGAAAGE